MSVVCRRWKRSNDRPTDRQTLTDPFRTESVSLTQLYDNAIYPHRMALAVSFLNSLGISRPRILMVWLIFREMISRKHFQIRKMQNVNGKMMPCDFAAFTVNYFCEEWPIQNHLSCSHEIESIVFSSSRPCKHIVFDRSLAGLLRTHKHLLDWSRGGGGCIVVDGSFQIELSAANGKKSGYSTWGREMESVRRRRVEARCELKKNVHVGPAMCIFYALLRFDVLNSHNRRHHHQSV